MSFGEMPIMLVDMFDKKVREKPCSYFCPSVSVLTSNLEKLFFKTFVDGRIFPVVDRHFLRGR